MNPGAIGGLAFTPTPVGGFPEVVRAEPDGLLQGLPFARVDAVLDSNRPFGPVVGFQVYNSALPSAHEVRPIMEAASTIFRHVTGEADVVVVAPEREPTTIHDPRVPTPRTWIIACEDERSVDLALQRGVCSTPIGTILFYRPQVTIGRFMFIAGGFAHDRNGSVLQAIFAVFSGPIIFPIILDLVQSNSRFTSTTPEDAARAVLASLTVRVSTLQNGNLVAAVFCDSPTQSIPLWRDWRDRTASLPFPSPLNSTGTARRPVLCAGCHGADHLTHMCPFQHIPGWNAPAPGTVWRHPAPAQIQGGGGQQQPPPPPPAGGAASRGRSGAPRRTNSFNGMRRDPHWGGGAGAGAGGGAPGASAC